MAEETQDMDGVGLVRLGDRPLRATGSSCRSRGDPCLHAGGDVLAAR